MKTIITKDNLNTYIIREALTNPFGFSYENNIEVINSIKNEVKLMMDSINESNSIIDNVKYI